MDSSASFKGRFLPCHKRLYHVALRIMGNPHDAEDMVQELYLKLWKKRDELSEILNPEAYCITLIKNQCLDSLRKKQPEFTAEKLDIADHPPSIELKEELSHILRLIEKLPEPQKQVMWMRDVEESSFEEIEQATGLSPINIRVTLSRARKKIREQFNEIMSYATR